jgi:Uma2 family endonuclease
MSVVSAPPVSEPQPSRLLTCADLAALPEELPSGPVRYELDNGRLVVMAPPGFGHGTRQNRIGSALYQQGELRGYGKAFTDAGVILRRNPDRVVSPDAAFVAKRSFPVRTSAEDYLETIPELVVEVRSKNDTIAELKDKLQEFIDAGTELAWLADGVTKTVTALRPGRPPQVYSIHDALDAEGIIPGFHLPVAEVFRE